ncbi:unnamed protein product [Phytomonas sp. Hart1]|nr:unnamed protein product [Phytomonas sp. Hart1]|eukprot:CCW68380.1 unnamed protein product [Phytomonas sp. isolate Hart1]
MWSVIRKEQGLSPNVSAYDEKTPQDRRALHQRVIVLHETRPFTPYINPKLYTRAYGDLNYDKLARWLHADDPGMRLQAINHLIELYTENREHCVRSLNYDLLPGLIGMLGGDPVEEIRGLCASALTMLLNEPTTQSRVDREGWVKYLSGIIAATRDRSDGVVVLSLRALAACHIHYNHFLLTELLITELNGVELVMKLIQSSPNATVRAVACGVLTKMFDVGETFARFARLRGVEILTQTISEAAAEDAMLLAGAAEVISRGCECPPCRHEAVHHETMKVLFPHLAHGDLLVRVAVSAALAQITLLEEAKMQASDWPLLLEAVLNAIYQEVERDVLVFLSKFVYNIAEFPKGRAALRPCRSHIEKLYAFTAEGEEAELTRQTLANTIEILYRK